MTPSKATIKWLHENGFLETVNVDDHVARQALLGAISKGKIDMDKLVQLQGTRDEPKNKTFDRKAPEPFDVLAEAAKGAGHGFGRDREPATQQHPGLNRQSQLLTDEQRQTLGVWVKHTAYNAGFKETPLDRREVEMLHKSFQQDRWVGRIGKQESDHWDPREVEHAAKHIDSGNFHTSVHRKELIEDALSGGQYLSPYVFDALLVTFPLLFGELFPLITVRDIFAASVQSGTLGNPTVIWGQTDGTSTTEFDTAGLVGNLSLSIRNVMIALEVSRDLLEDTPANLGGYLEQIIPDRFSAELDRVIANGAATNASEPTGVFQSSGVTVIPTSVPGGPTVLGDLESLMFGVGKQYRQPNMNPVFLSNDTCYRRCRGIPRGPIDAARLMGMDYSSYKLLEYPAKIQNDLSNNQCGFVCLSRYHMYRRLGTSMRWYREGQSLAMKNTALLVVRARYGGKMVDTNAAAISTSFPN
jgi:HK97 family phage major capsid protein